MSKAGKKIIKSARNALACAKSGNRKGFLAHKLKLQPLKDLRNKPHI